MASLIIATSSPLRKEKWQGQCCLTAMNVEDAKTGEHICSMVQGIAPTWQVAYREFYADCKEKGIFLKPRLDGDRVPHA
jgi:hypothetical protein